MARLLLPAIDPGIATPAPTIPIPVASPLSVSALIFTLTFPAAAAAFLTAKDLSESDDNGSLAEPLMI